MTMIISAAKAFARVSMSQKCLCSIFCDIESAINNGDFSCNIDFNGINEKEKITEFLKNLGYEVEDTHYCGSDKLCVSWG